MSCSIAKAADVVGDPWTLLVLRDAIIGVTRFDDFSRRLGIPRATLSSRLDGLCATGLMERRRYQDHPPRDEYVLTEQGRATRSIVVAFMRWGDQWRRDDPPPTRLVDAATGREIDPVLVDRATGTPLDELDVQVVGPVSEGVRDRAG